MRDALGLIRDVAPNGDDGEMHGDAALAKQVLDRVFPWFRPRRGRQSTHHAQSGRGQHLLQPVARRCERRRYGRTYSVGSR